MSPAELLATTDQLLSTVVPETRGRWPRACAWLTRLALEQALDEFWLRTLPEGADCSMRAQLLLLPGYADAATVAAARDAWFGLAPRPTTALTTSLQQQASFAAGTTS